MTMDPADQNVDNIQIISSVIFDSAAVLAPVQVIEPEVIEMVSCHTQTRIFTLWNAK